MKFLIVGEQTLLRDSLHSLIGQLEEKAVVLDAQDTHQAFNTLNLNPDLDLLILILDLLSDGWRPLTTLKLRYPDLPVVVLANSENIADIQRAISSGAQGFVSTVSTWSAVMNALRWVLAGKIYVPLLSTERAIDEAVDVDTVTPIPSTNPTSATDYMPRNPHVEDGYRLTPRQLEVLGLLRLGKSNKEIAKCLRMAEGTVKIHCMAIFRELGVTNRTQAAIAAEAYFA